jgi:hypothetical protein
MSPDSHMNRQELEAVIPAAGAAVTQDTVVGSAEVSGTVTSVTLSPEASVVGNATAYRTFRLINKGQTGAGSTVIASFATNATPANDLTAYDEKAIPITGTATVAKGDVLVLDETVASTGVAHSGGKVAVEISR